MQQMPSPIGRAPTVAAVAALLSLNLSAPAPTLAAPVLRSPTLHAVSDKRRIDGHVYVGDRSAHRLSPAQRSVVSRRRGSGS
jgi:hypothetical protein